MRTTLHGSDSQESPRDRELVTNFMESLSPERHALRGLLPRLRLHLRTRDKVKLTERAHQNLVVSEEALVVELGNLKSKGLVDNRNRPLEQEVHIVELLAALNDPRPIFKQNAVESWQYFPHEH